MRKTKNTLRLGVNIDHIATIRNARGEHYPEPLRAAQIAQKAGADGITVHLREDRRHIRDDDLHNLCNTITLPINLEIAPTEEMHQIALKHKPHACCIVPEKREELTTEGGLDIIRNTDTLRPFLRRLADAGIRASLFIDPEKEQIHAAKDLNAPVIELHTGAYCSATLKHKSITNPAQPHPAISNELNRIRTMVEEAHTLGLEVHAGHGLTFNNVTPIAAMQHITELNIGHFIISEAIFIGLENAIRTMINHMQQARETAQEA